MLKYKKTLIALSIFLTLLAGCSSQRISPAPQGSTLGQHRITPKMAIMPPQLGVIRTNAEGIISDVGKKDWTMATTKLNTIKVSFELLKPTMKMNNASKKVLNDLSKSISNLEKNISAKKEYETMLGANAITKILPDASDIFKPTVPTDFARISYYAREININVDKNAWLAARANLSNIEKLWTGLSSKVSNTYNKDVTKFTTDINDLNKSITDKNSITAKANVKSMLDSVKLLETDLRK